MPSLCALLLLLVPIALSLPAEQCPANNTTPSDSKRPLKVLISSPTLGWAHMQFQAKLADLLSEAGHEVHVVTFEMNPQLEANLVTKGQRVIRVARWPQRREAMLEMKFLKGLLSGVNNMLLDGTFEDLNQLFADSCEEILSNHQLLSLLQNEKYDVGISEMWDACWFGVFHHTGVKVKLGSYALQMNSLVGSMFGVPTFSSYVSNLFSSSLNAPQMGFIDRAVNFYTDLYEYAFYRDLPFKLQQHLFHSTFGPHFPSLRSIMSNISLVFVNSHELFELPRPSSNKIIKVGGIVNSEKKERRELTPRQLGILNSSSDGVVLLAFGTLNDPSKLSPQQLQTFLSTFAAFPSYDFIWKFNAGDSNHSQLSGAIPNLHTFEWVDQKAMLAHPKMRAFITHCGLNSVIEAMGTGVPIVGIPMAGDTFFNCATMKGKGVGVVVDIRQLSQSKLTSALYDILHSPKYADSAALLARKLELAPFSPAERFMKWVEFAAEFPDGLNELNLPTEEDMGLLVYYSMDVIGATLMGVLMMLVAVVKGVGHLDKRIGQLTGEGKGKKVL